MREKQLESNNRIYGKIYVFMTLSSYTGLEDKKAALRSLTTKDCFFGCKMSEF